MMNGAVRPRGIARVFPHLDRWICTFVGLLLPLEVSVGGRLFASEILLLLLLPWLLVRSKGIWSSIPIDFVVIASILWLGAQIATDIIRETPTEDWTRGISKIVFTLLNLSALTLLIERDRDKIIHFGIGMSLGLIVMMVRQGLGITTEAGWKFGAGSGFTGLFFIVAAHPFLAKHHLARAIWILGIVAVSLWVGARNLAGIAIVALLFTFLGSTSIGSKGPKPRLLSPGVTGATLVIMLLGVYQAYQFSVESGWLGEKLKAKHENQVRRGGGNAILGGRSESQVSVIAVSQSPIIGHGSWAKDKRLAQMTVKDDYATGTLKGRLRDPDLIPTHSYLMGAWVEAGIFGAVFWLTVMVRTVRAFLLLPQVSDPLAPYLAFILLELLWNIPFSPFGAENRVTAPFAIVCVSYVLCEARARKPASDACVV